MYVRHIVLWSWWDRLFDRGMTIIFGAVACIGYEWAGHCVTRFVWSSIAMLVVVLSRLAVGSGMTCIWVRHAYRRPVQSDASSGELSEVAA